METWGSLTVLRKWVVLPRSDDPPVQGWIWLDPFHICQKGRKRNRSRRGRESAKTRSAWASERTALDLRVSVWRQTYRQGKRNKWRKWVREKQGRDGERLEVSDHLTEIQVERGFYSNSPWGWGDAAAEQPAHQGGAAIGHSSDISPCTLGSLVLLESYNCHLWPVRVTGTRV